MSTLAEAEVVLKGDDEDLNATLARAQASMANAGRQMTRLGTELSILVTLPLTEMGKASLTSAAEFDASMRKVAALTDTTTQQVDSWTGEVRSLSKQYGITGKEAADALYFISSAGVHGEKAMEALRAVLKGTAVGLGDTETLAHAATSAMNAYAKSGMTATKALDILAGGIRSSNFSIAELAPNLGRVTGMAAALGIPLTDVVGTLAVFGHTGTDAAEAATQLSSVFNTLLGHSVEATKALAMHGLTLAGLRKQATGPEGLIGVMRTLNKTFGGQVDELKVVIPNIRAFRGVMNALAQDTTFVDRILNQVKNSTSLVDDAFLKSQGPMFQAKQAWATLTDAGISLGNLMLPILIPAFRSLFEEVHNLVDRMDKLNPETKGLITMMLGLAAAVGPLVLVVGTLKWALGGLPMLAMLTPASQLIGVFTGLRTAVMGFVSAMVFQFTAAIESASIAGTGLTGVLYGLRPAAMSLATALAPLVANVTLIAGIGLITYKWMQMKTVIMETAQAVELAKTRMQEQFLFIGTDAANAAKEIVRLKDRVAALKKDSATRYDNAWEEQYIGDLNQMIVGLQRVVDADKAMHTSLATGDGGDKDPWVLLAAKTLQKMNADLLVASRSSYQLGQSFNLGKAQATAYDEAIRKLTEEHVPLDVALDSTGTTLGMLITRYADATRGSTDFKQESTELNEVFRRAKEITRGAMTEQEKYRSSVLDLVIAASKGIISLDEMREGIVHLKEALAESNQAYRDAKALVEASLTPQQKYDEGAKALEISMRKGIITMDQYIQALKYLAELTGGTIKKDQELKHAMESIGDSGINAIVEFAIKGKNTFKDFVTSAIEDIARLLLKMELIRLIFPEGGGEAKGPSIFKSILGFAGGGFLGSNQLGIVGENGPELVMAGNRGMTIAPFASSSASPGSGGTVIHVHVPVSSPDAKGVAQWFDDNQAHVAGAFVKAYQKSAVLQRQIKGT